MSFNKNEWTSEKSVVIVDNEYYLKEIKLRKISSGGGGNIYKKAHSRHEHRVVAEFMIGRKLKKNEIVHHKNEDKRDNRPDNLQVMTINEHTRLHATKNNKCIKCPNKHYANTLCRSHYMKKRYKQNG